MKRSTLLLTFIVGIVLCLVTLGISGYGLYRIFTSDSPSTGDQPQGGTASLQSIGTFDSMEDFQDYLSRADELSSSSGYGSGSMGMELSPISAPSFDTGAEEDASKQNVSESDSPERYSETNVQVSGIDEPDIVKTDGETIYFSKEGYWLDTPVPMDDTELTEERDAPSELDVMPPYNYASTRIINAFPPSAMQEIASLDLNGELLLSDSSLIILSYNSIQAFDVSDPSNPEEMWKFDSSDNASIVTSRLYENTLYVVTQQYIDYGTPCPIEPFLRDDSPVVTIRCTDIYHPASVVDTDTTYSIFKIEPDTGRIIDSTSFIGAAGSSIVYMSANNIYLTYTHQGDYATILIDFFLENDDLLSDEIIVRLRNLKSYDISMPAKLTELMTILQNFEQGLHEDEAELIGNEIQNRMTDYMDIHGRELLLTGIVKIDQKTLEYEAVGTVPGYLLNQWSLDEYNNNMRVATTVGNSWMWGFSSDTESANDVYVLDDEMRTIGEIQDLGLTETIYSVRFIKNAGYVVTFRQTDPFYVLDLSDPRNPEIEGELEIPGYSSYLHPISDDIILGVGQEDWNVKLSLFDVSNPRLPQEIAKYTLDTSWTEVNSNHHAFMIDAEHKIFFLPGSDTGYVFSYEGDDLSLVKAVANVQARRALYIDNYLYVIGDDEIVVLDETTWERVKELHFNSID